MGSSTSFWHSVQFHQEAESPYLHKLVQDQQLWIKNKTVLWVQFDEQIDTIKIGKPNYKCDEYNSNSFMHCMENYYSRKLGCILPWSLNNSLKYARLNICEGKEKFEQFKNVAMNILKPDKSNELINEGCFIPNCVQRSWKIKKEKDIDEERNGELPTGFEFEWLEPSKVLFREDVKLYTLVNFFGEVGGYLGLLLGESLLSYIITTSRWVQVIWVKFKANCWKSEEETVNLS